MEEILTKMTPKIQSVKSIDSSEHGNVYAPSKMPQTMRVSKQSWRIKQSMSPLYLKFIAASDPLLKVPINEH